MCISATLDALSEDVLILLASAEGQWFRVATLAEKSASRY